MMFCARARQDMPRERKIQPARAAPRHAFTRRAARLKACAVAERVRASTHARATREVSLRLFCHARGLRAARYVPRALTYARARDARFVASSPRAYARYGARSARRARDVAPWIQALPMCA